MNELDSRLIHRERMDLRGFNVVERDGDSIKISKTGAGRLNEDFWLWTRDTERLADFVERTDAINEDREEADEVERWFPPWFYAVKRVLATLGWFALIIAAGVFLDKVFGQWQLLGWGPWFDFNTVANFACGMMVAQRHLR